MKCPNCGGKGKYKNGFGKIDVCYYCLGTGEVNDKCERVKTEQEYIQTCTTEQLADWLVEHIDCVNCYCKKDLCSRNYDSCKLTFINWLKQPHREE